jgi:hypothetical protein
MFFGKKRIKVRFQIIICELAPIPDNLIITNLASKALQHTSFSIGWRRGNKLKGTTKINEPANGVVMFDDELFTLEGTITQDKSGTCKEKPMNFYINFHKPSPKAPEIKMIGETSFDLGDLFLKKEQIELNLVVQKVCLFYVLYFFVLVNVNSIC